VDWFPDLTINQKISLDRKQHISKQNTDIQKILLYGVLNFNENLRFAQG
jgi:hypothetical protein